LIDIQASGAQDIFSFGADGATGFDCTARTLKYREGKKQKVFSRNLSKFLSHGTDLFSIKHYNVVSLSGGMQVPSTLTFHAFFAFLPLKKAPKSHNKRIILKIII
jgi:hypothetical protein